MTPTTIDAPLATLTDKADPRYPTRHDRRQHSRLPVDRPCKVLHLGSRRFSSARTCNVSLSGALITVQGQRLIPPGEELDLIIAWSDQPLLPAEQMVRARVVRHVGVGGDAQTLAVEFARAQAAALVKASAA